MRSAAGVVAFAALVWGTVAAPRAAEVSQPSLRHLVYSVRAGASTVTEVKRSGFGQNGGNSEDFGVSGILNSGTITVDVLSVTNDGALVMDVVENAQSRSTPRARVAVFDDGRLLYDNRADLMPESLELLRLCARHVFDEHAEISGTKWTEDHPQSNQVESTTYETGEVLGDRSLVRFDRNVQMKGISATVETRAAVLYDRHYLMPVVASLAQRIRTNDVEQAKRTIINWQIRLLEDSFSKLSATSEPPAIIMPAH